jgi:hypothetical protein
LGGGKTTPPGVVDTIDMTDRIWIDRGGPARRVTDVTGFKEGVGVKANTQ